MHGHKLLLYTKEMKGEKRKNKEKKIKEAMKDSVYIKCLNQTSKPAA